VQLLSKAASLPWPNVCQKVKLTEVGVLVEVGVELLLETAPLELGCEVGVLLVQPTKEQRRTLPTKTNKDFFVAITASFASIG
jgi:hypothetical protein